MNHDDEQCFDLAVVATTPRYRWHPVEAGPEEIILRSPVSIRFSVARIYYGTYNSGTINVSTSLHVGFNHVIKNFLLFLKKESDGKYSLQDMNYQLVQDRAGQFIWPIAAPLDSSSINYGFVPANYESLMRPIRYRSKDAWWLVTPRDVDPPSADEYSWGQIDKKGTITASRGIAVVDLVSALADQRCKSRVDP